MSMSFAKQERRSPKAKTTGPGNGKVVTLPAWRNGLIITPRTELPKRCLANVMHVLAVHPDWQDVLAYDEFGMTVITRKVPPMRRQDEPASYTLGDWTDEDSARTAAWFAAECDFEPAILHVDQAVAAIARKCIVHPVCDYLRSLIWDGVARLDRFATQYLGAPPSRYSAAVGRRWMLAAVARVFAPGAKVDSMLGLEGEQGIGKSSALRLLAGPDWFADTGITIGDKDSYQALRRKWIYEFAELASIRGRDIERVKNFLSSQCDTFRASYGRRTQDHPRQVVFAGSTNELHYLADPTGSRRFWPLKCTTIDLEALRRDRDQLWAEARVAYEAGEPWHLDTAELRALAAAEAAEREEHDDWIDIVRRWLASPSRPDGHGHREPVSLDDGITTADVALGALGFPAERITPATTKRVGRVLHVLGFRRRQVRLSGNWYAREWRYFHEPSVTCDVPSDAGAAENKPTSCVTRTSGARTYRDDLGRSRADQGKSAVTSVTCDVADAEDAEERAAIQSEGRL